MNTGASQFDTPASYPDEDSVFAALYDSEPFEAFDMEMDEALGQLERRWVHLAAPKASSIRVRTFNLTHPKKAK